MILFIIYTLLKKYSNQRKIKTFLKINQFLKGSIHRLLGNLLIRLLLFLPIVSIAQNVKLNYKITQGRNDIGWLRIEKNSTENKADLLLVSEIKTKFILPFTMFTRESSTFENGKLIYSSQFRKTNGSTKLDKQTKLVADKYEVLENGEKVKLAFPTINTNLLSLYFQEPITLNSVYCDKQQCFVKVTKTEDGGYKMKFPNGNSNCFYYKEGICTKIKIGHSFYTAEIILKP
jgi:hypothetical protein